MAHAGSTASAVVDATLGQRRRVQQPSQLGFGQATVLLRHLQHRAFFLVGTLGDRGGFFLADDRVQRGHQDRIAVQRFANPALVHYQPGNRRIGQQPRDIAQHMD